MGTHVLQLLYGGERELGRGGETIIVKDVAFTYFLEFIVYPKFYIGDFFERHARNLP